MLDEIHYYHAAGIYTFMRNLIVKMYRMHTIFSDWNEVQFVYIHTLT